MFEDSTFESCGVIHTRSRNWMPATFAINGTILLALVLFPILHPEALPRRVANLLLLAPRAEQAPKALPTTANRSEAAASVTKIEVPRINVPRSIPIGIRRGNDGGPVPDGQLLTMDPMGMGVPGGDPFRGIRQARVQAAIPRGPVHVSSGVARGLLVQKVLPQYPALAKATRTEGVVELQATISKAGTIENLRVLRGPAMLQQASLEAVRRWRYRPYLLNGQPIEVETTIEVDFRMER